MTLRRVALGEIDFSEPMVVVAWLGQVDAHLDDADRQALAEEISRQYRRYRPACRPLDSRASSRGRRKG